MKSEIESRPVWLKVVGSLALGAAAMYVLDPDKGRRRRAIASDKARRFVANAGSLASIAARDVTYRMQGVRVQARRLFGRGGVPDDLVLIERLRAKMGRVVSNPHAIQIGAHDGRVTLSGPILASEAQPLLHVVRSAPSVSEVEDHLIVHERPESIPSLQGTPSPTKMRSRIMRENWTPTQRVAAMLSSVALIVGLVLTAPVQGEDPPASCRRAGCSTWHEARARSMTRRARKAPWNRVWRQTMQRRRNRRRVRRRTNRHNERSTR